MTGILRRLFVVFGWDDTYDVMDDCCVIDADGRWVRVSDLVDHWNDSKKPWQDNASNPAPFKHRVFTFIREGYPEEDIRDSRPEFPS